MVHISVVMNCHTEGRLLYPTLRSISACIDEAEDAGISTEWLLVRDSSDQSTIDQIDRFSLSEVRKIDVSCQDLGLARNHGTKAALGKYIAFIDADDLWSSNWLVAAYTLAESMQNQRTVLHTETAICFGAVNHIWRISGSDDADHDSGALLSHNPWSVSSFATKEIYLQFPYCAVNLACGFFYEDWYWNCQTIACGIEHRTVPNTFHCYRFKPSLQKSLMAIAEQERCIMPVNDLFALGYQNI